MAAPSTVCKLLVLLCCCCQCGASGTDNNADEQLQRLDSARSRSRSPLNQIQHVSNMSLRFRVYIIDIVDWLAYYTRSPTSRKCFMVHFMNSLALDQIRQIRQPDKGQCFGLSVSCIAFLITFLLFVLVLERKDNSSVRWCVLLVIANFIKCA